MKTSFLKSALLVLTFTTGVIAHAGGGGLDVSHDDFELYRENTEGKIAAAEAAQKASSNPLHRVVKMKIELDTIGEQIKDLQDQVGQSTNDSGGAIKGLADKTLSIEVLKEEFLAIDKEIQKEHGYGLALRLDEADEIVKKARHIKKEAKQLAEDAMNFVPEE